jgi:hypothetical protein
MHNITKNWFSRILKKPVMEKKKRKQKRDLFGRNKEEKEDTCMR